MMACKYSEKMSNYNDLAPCSGLWPRPPPPNPGKGRGVATGAPRITEKKAVWDPLKLNAGTGT